MNRIWLRIGIIAFVALVILKIINYLDKPRTTAQWVKEDFEKEWHYTDAAHEEMLVKRFESSRLSPCPNIYVKKSLDNQDILIACTADGITYSYYIDRWSAGSLASLSSDGMVKPTLY